MLYRVLSDHLEDFVQRVESAGRPVPWFVQAELEGFLGCGDLRHGFARQRCPRCDFTRLIPFSCGGRGFCPACLAVSHGRDGGALGGQHHPKGPGASVGAELSSFFAIRLWPTTPAFAGAGAEATTAALGVFIREVFRWLRQAAKRELGLSSVREAHPPRGPPVPQQLSFAFAFEHETSAHRRRFTKKA